MTAGQPNPNRLRDLAQAHGVAVEYRDYQGKLRQVAPQTLVDVLAALGVKADTPARIEAAWQAQQDASWLDPLPPTVVVRAEEHHDIAVHVPHGSQVQVQIHLAGGERFDLVQLENWMSPREVAGTLIGEATFQIPAGLPLGWHQIVADREIGGLTRATLAVVPSRISPAALENSRSWGVMAQLYSVTSAESWGMGDFTDLADLAAIFADQGADFVLVNPLHAAEPVPPISDSPYLPVSRRFLNPLYIRPEDVPEWAALPPAERKALQESARAAKLHSDRIDREQSWTKKSAALELLYQAPRSFHREAAFTHFQTEGGQPLTDFALWCALVERYGPTLPAELAEVASDGVPVARRELAERIDFFRWLQWIADTQLRAAQEAARDCGMSIGVMTDLAVGVHPFGAELWAARQYYAEKATVGAPPDFYNQQGQDWSQPPLHPRALQVAGYEPLREMIRAALRHAGALRIDHILGFFRLWWIPVGNTPDQGAYVAYNHEDMIGILLLEAHLAGAVIIGEDLGTVEPWVRDYLAGRGILGTQVLWFEKGWDGKPLPREYYRREALATVNTHDLPPTAGYLTGEQVNLRARLGLLAEPEEKVREEADAELAELKQQVIAAGYLATEKAEDEEAVIAALHAYAAATPSLLFAMSLVDCVGERRVQNQPGTHQEYPNWCIPLGDSAGRTVTLTQLAASPRLHGLCQQVVAARVSTS